MNREFRRDRPERVKHTLKLLICPYIKQITIKKKIELVPRGLVLAPPISGTNLTYLVLPSTLIWHEHLLILDYSTSSAFNCLISKCWSSKQLV